MSVVNAFVGNQIQTASILETPDLLNVDSSSSVTEFDLISYEQIELYVKCCAQIMRRNYEWSSNYAEKSVPLWTQWLVSDFED